jgi:hypothetical protein
MLQQEGGNQQKDGLRVVRGLQEGIQNAKFKRQKKAGAQCANLSCSSFCFLNFAF